MTPETKFKNQVKKFLDENNIYHIPYFPTIYTPKGVPDILACVNGKFIGVEVKAENGKPSKLQERHQQLIQKSGGLCYILYPIEFESFKQDILGLKNERS
jgi:Holliday junction resolvase